MSDIDRLVQRVKDIGKSQPAEQADEIPAIAEKAIRGNERALFRFLKGLRDELRYEQVEFLDSRWAWQWVIKHLEKVLEDYWIEAYWEFRSAHPEVPIDDTVADGVFSQLIDETLRRDHRRAERMIAKAIASLLEEELSVQESPESILPSRNGVSFDPDHGNVAYIDHVRHQLNEAEANMWRVLWKAGEAGERRIKGAEICQDPDGNSLAKKIKHDMEAPVKHQISSDHKGYWLKCFFPDEKSQPRPQNRKRTKKNPKGTDKR